MFYTFNVGQKMVYRNVGVCASNDIVERPNIFSIMHISGVLSN